MIKIKYRVPGFSIFASMIFEKLANYFSTKKLSDYKPVKHTFFNNPEIANALHKDGYYVANFLEERDMQLLFELYEKNHQFKNEKGGAFISTLSSDLTYRKKMHDSINEILVNSFDKWLHDYKDIVNLFFIKTPGKSSKITMHQDVATIDEEKYSNVNIWIPLQAATPLNGSLFVIPRSHNIFSPYRCRTVSPFLKFIEKDLYKYSIPIYLRPGQVIFFDSRIFHFSAPNVSGQIRIVVICRIHPAESSVISYFNEYDEDNLRVEMWKYADDYFLSLDNSVDSKRSEEGEFLGYRTNIAPLTMSEFEKKRKKHGIEIKNPILPENEEQTNFIHEL